MELLPAIQLFIIMRISVFKIILDDNPVKNILLMGPVNQNLNHTGFQCKYTLGQVKVISRMGNLMVDGEILHICIHVHMYIYVFLLFNFLII